MDDDDWEPIPHITTEMLGHAIRSGQTAQGQDGADMQGGQDFLDLRTLIFNFFFNGSDALLRNI